MDGAARRVGGLCRGACADLAAARRRGPDLREPRRAMARRSPRPGRCGPTRRSWSAATTTFNPKMNNVRKGLEAASRPVVALCDAGIILDAGELAARGAVCPTRSGWCWRSRPAIGRRTSRPRWSAPTSTAIRHVSLWRPTGWACAVASGGVTIHHARHAAAHRQLARLQSTGSPTTIRSCARCANSACTTWLASVMPRLPVGGAAWQVVWRRQVRWGRTRLRLPSVAARAAGARDRLGGVGARAGLVAACGGGFGAGALRPRRSSLHTCRLACRRGVVPAGRRPAFGPRAGAAAHGARNAGAFAHVAGLSSAASHRLARHRSRRAMASHVTRGRYSRRLRMKASTNGSITTSCCPQQHGFGDLGFGRDKPCQAALSPRRELIVDGSEVTYMSAAGVRVFAGALHGAEELGARVVFCRFTGAAADCLDWSAASPNFSTSPSCVGKRHREAANRDPQEWRRGLRQRGAQG